VTVLDGFDQQMAYGFLRADATNGISGRANKGSEWDSLAGPSTREPPRALGDDVLAAEDSLIVGYQ
jgi:hypothetical protein